MKAKVLLALVFGCYWALSTGKLGPIDGQTCRLANLAKCPKFTGVCEVCSSTGCQRESAPVRNSFAASYKELRRTGQFEAVSLKVDEAGRACAQHVGNLAKRFVVRFALAGGGIGPETPGLPLIGPRSFALLSATVFPLPVRILA